MSTYKRRRFSPNVIYGPAYRFETAGPAKKVRSNRASRDTAVAERLWTLSVELTGVNPSI